MESSSDRAFVRWGIYCVLTLVFVVLKSRGEVDWSWWAVFSPLWVPFFFSFFLFGLLLMALGVGITADRKQMENNIGMIFSASVGPMALFLGIGLCTLVGGLFARVCQAGIPYAYIIGSTLVCWILAFVMPLVIRNRVAGGE